ncbi:TPR repeat-containing protein DDB_G0287407-like isoform X2 [Littorina saxatilis]|uniref:TPR repeat-containing protein DDB_G0287407-like isoform X2 n=1 Tax=Littorina saxatilis TaxID=31220 RepID=UPI0038B456F8
MDGLPKREKGKLREPKTCRIFFSSPFGGMEEEREELTRKYFPHIQHACNAKGVQFVAVDMRWGITSQAAENAQVINICLREIDRSDIFVGFFGQRYGWHGADDQQLQDNFDNAVGLYPWLDAARDRSVTELEFLHGHLNSPSDLPACICFRDKAYDDAQREEGQSKGDKKQVFKYSSESDHATTMMDDLKKRVKAIDNKCLGVNMAYSHPHEGAKFMFDTIWPHLSDVLLAKAEEAKVSKREQRLAEHTAFRARHVTVYDGGQQYFDFLNKVLDKEEKGSVLITGPAGSGKSAVLCNWTAELEKSRPDVVLIYHFVGCAPGTTAASEILSRLLWEVKHVLGKEEEDAMETKDKKEDTQNVETLQVLLLGAIEEVLQETQKRVVIVVDGLNSTLKAGKTSKHLYWLPDTWPTGVSFITSTVDTDTLTCDLLVTQREYENLAIQPLEDTAKREICVKVLKKSGKELSPEQLNRIVAADQTNNPLYLRLVLAELSIFGYFRLLDKKIDSLIYCKDVGELLQKIFTRLEEDYNGKEEHTKLVQEVLCAIELSHRGLSEKELMEMLGVDTHIWSPLHFAMEGLLVSHAGLLRFAFTEISQAVQAKYLQDEKERKGMLKKLIGYFDKQLQNLPPWTDLDTELSKRPVEELPWLYQAAGDMEGLSATLLNIFTLQRMQQDFKYEFLEFWKLTGKKMSEICDLYLSAFDLAVADLYLHNQDMTFNSMTPPGVKLRPLLQSVRDLLDLAECKQGALKVLQKDLSILTLAKDAMEPTRHFKDMLLLRYYVACSMIDCNRFEEGENLHRQVMKECRGYLEEHPDDEVCIDILGMTCNGIGVMCYKQRRFQEAVELYQESLEQHTRLNIKKQMADSFCNLGVALMENDEPQKGVEYMQKSLKLTEELYFGHLPLDIGNLLTNIGICHRRLKDFEQAEAMYKRSLEVKANAVGWDHDVVAMAYMNLCTLMIYKEDYTAAEQYIRKAMTIYENNGATLDKTQYRQATENLVASLLNLQKVEEALSIFLPLFCKLVEVKEMDHCIHSVHRHMAKYLLSIGDTKTAREVTLALIDCKGRQPTNYIFLDHLQLMFAEEERPSLADHCTLEHALTLWPGNPDLTRRIIEYHALPADDIDRILKLQKVCAENNRNFGAYTYEACADWCLAGKNEQNKEAAAQVLEAGVEEYPDELNLRTKVMVDNANMVVLFCAEFEDKGNGRQCQHVCPVLCRI